MYRKGTLVTLTNDALENYGEEWRGVKLRITHVATKYMPVRDFYPRMPDGYHPGYDESAEGKPLYDLEVAETGEDFPGSLYWWEVKRA